MENSKLLEIAKEYAAKYAAEELEVLKRMVSIDSGTGDIEGNDRYRLNYSVEKANEHGLALSYGSDTFCHIVQTLESLSHSSNNGINALQQWVEGGSCPF